MTPLSSVKTHRLFIGIAACLILAAAISCGGSGSSGAQDNHKTPEQDPVDPPGSGKVVVYPGPSGIACSDLYAVKVSRNHGTYDSFVYISRRIKHTNQSNSWTTFSFQGEVTVEVEKLTGPAPSTVKLRPSSKAVPVELAGRTARFTLRSPAKLSVEFDTDLIPEQNAGQPRDAMLVFADPLETDVPDPDDPGVAVFRDDAPIPSAGGIHTLYFPPGLHFIGGYRDLIDPSTSILENDPENPPPCYSPPHDTMTDTFSDLPQNIKTVYLAGGAYVRGAFRMEERENFTLRGRGILSGDKFAAVTDESALGENDMGLYFFQDTGQIIGDRSIDYDRRYHMFWIEWGTHITLEGITIANVSHMGIRLFGYDHKVHNIKVMGWHQNNDGITIGDDSELSDSFFKMDDDFIKIAYCQNTEIHDNVLWQWDNGAAFQFSWNSNYPAGNVRIYNNDVIHASPNSGINCAVFDALHAGKAHLKGFLFENIRIEGPHARTLYMEVGPNPWDEDKTTHGWISDVTFRGIHIEEQPENRSVIKGYNPEHRISDILFQGCWVGDTLLTDTNHTDFFETFDPGKTADIRFSGGN